MKIIETSNTIFIRHWFRWYVADANHPVYVTRRKLSFKDFNKEA